MATDLEAAIAAALTAGEILAGAFGGRHQVRYKGEIDLVTQSDVEAEEAIVRAAAVCGLRTSMVQLRTSMCVATRERGMCALHRNDSRENLMSVEVIAFGSPRALCHRARGS